MPSRAITAAQQEIAAIFFAEKAAGGHQEDKHHRRGAQSGLAYAMILAYHRDVAHAGQ
jgi:hypothetical protein